jgi:hypothetical protein
MGRIAVRRLMIKTSPLPHLFPAENGNPVDKNWVIIPLRDSAIATTCYQITNSVIPAMLLICWDFNRCLLGILKYMGVGTIK